MIIPGHSILGVLSLYNYYLNAPMRGDISEDFRYPPQYYYNKIFIICSLKYLFLKFKNILKMFGITSLSIIMKEKFIEKKYKGVYFC